MRYEVKGNRMQEGRKAVSFRETPNKGGSFAPEGIVLHDTAGSLDRFSSVDWLLTPPQRRRPILWWSGTGALPSWPTSTSAAGIAGEAAWAAVRT